ncbi:MAG: DUF1611 domain-containing protein [Proteobacteria bacterium]|nr:DUF1611 domain-containing protein [Pseudomonadota bacterium]
MEKASVPRIMLAGTSAGVGKSLVTLGLAYELRRRGLSVSICITHSNLSQALLYRRVSGRYVRCIDPRLLSAGQIVLALREAAVGADIVLIDGTGGLFDGGSAGIFDGADSDIAALTRTPTALVMDGRCGGNTVGATLKGFLHYAQGFPLVGAVLNRVDEASADDLRAVRDDAFFETVMQSMHLPKLVGTLPAAVCELPELPQLVSQEHNLGALSRKGLSELSSMVQRHFRLDELLQIAQHAPPLVLPPLEQRPEPQFARIAVADDSCFGLCFQDNLDLMRQSGAELIGFSPVADQRLPEDIGGIYLTAGYIDEYALDLAANAGLMTAMREFVGNGGVVYAEGASVALLSERFRSGERYLIGMGILPSSAESHPEELGYSEGVSTEGSVLGEGGLLCKGIYTNRWRYSRDIPAIKCMQVARLPHRSEAEGFSPTPNVLATFDLWHWGSCPDIAANFVNSVARYHQSRSR